MKIIKKIAPHLIRGQRGEKTAARYLKAQGLSIVAKNQRTRRGEIDLIAQDGATIVFVEVRLRNASSWVSAGQSITPSKQRKWKTAAQEYLLAHYPTPPDCRFDAILITEQPNGTEHIEWLRGIYL